MIASLARVHKILMLQSEREHFLFANPANMFSHNTATKVWNYRPVRFLNQVKPRQFRREIENRRKRMQLGVERQRCAENHAAKKSASYHHFGLTPWQSPVIPPVTREKRYRRLAEGFAVEQSVFSAQVFRSHMRPRSAVPTSKRELGSGVTTAVKIPV